VAGSTQNAARSREAAFTSGAMTTGAPSARPAFAEAAPLAEPRK
jgi:hypothetical protein